MSGQLTLALTELAASEVTGPWGPPVRVLCPAGRVEPVPCDCGFVGDWERRTVFVWHGEPGHTRKDSAIRKDLALGLPAMHGKEGWWCIEGWDERCPGCGDIERFDSNGNEVARLVEQAKVVTVLDARRRRPPAGR